MKKVLIISLTLVLSCSSCGYAKENVFGNSKEIAGGQAGENIELPGELEKYRGKFENSIRPYIRVTSKKGKTLAWESKFGGAPYMPLGYKYPKDKEGKPMRLLAQINFEEIPETGVYPAKGILQFYISSNDDVYGINFDKPCEQENFRILYFAEIIKDNSKIIKDFSFVNEPDDHYFPVPVEGRLAFSSETAPVAVDDYQFERILGVSAYDLFEDICGEKDAEELWDWYDTKYSGAGHKIGGYAFFTQNDPRENTYEEYNMLLLQIDTDDDMGIMWGDAGVANFFIRPEDLKNTDFSKVLYNWDCY